MDKIIIAMSGGVDSSVAAWLLKDAGYDVIGVSFRVIEKDNLSLNESNNCCSSEDISDARQVCEKIGIPFYSIDVSDKFKFTVIEPFIKAYSKGETPNPCLECNYHVKFATLLKIAKSLGAKLATGHYADICNYKGIKTIKRSMDKKKDQTYYLYNTQLEVLNILHFPLGKFEKSEIRKIAFKIGLKIFDKPDSQKICFIPNDYVSFIEESLGKFPIGNLVNINGDKIAKHNGIHNYTIGQRRGIGVGIGYKAYVIDINPKNNEVTIGPKEALKCNRILAKNIHQLVSIKLWPKKILLQITSHGIIYSATWKLLKNNKLLINFKEFGLGIALGQAAVIYDNNFLLGGGTISNEN